MCKTNEMEGWKTTTASGKLHDVKSMVRINCIHTLAKKMLEHRIYIKMTYPAIQYYELNWDAFKKMTIVRVAELIQSKQVYISKEPAYTISTARSSNG
jgi:hypothetical protein